MSSLSQLSKIQIEGHTLNLKQEFAHNLKGHLNFHQKTLRKGAQPDDFFKEISHEIDLKDLYKVVDIRLSNNHSKYCPIYVAVTNEVIQQQLNCKYLLQIWDNNKTLVYEQKLQDKLQLWGCSDKYFFYQPGQKDPLYDEMHILDMENIDSVVKILNLFEPGIPTSNDDKIKFIKVPAENFKGETIDLEADTLKMRVIDPELRLMGIFDQYFNFEREDHQVDFNYLEVNNFDDDEKFSYTFKQSTEIIPRINVSNFPYSVALRKSGNIDIYWNCERKYSSDGSGIKCLDIEITTRCLFFKMLEDNKEVYYQIEHEKSRILNWDMAEKIQNEEFNFVRAINQNAKHFCNIYTKMMIVSEDQTLMIIAHRNFLSCYDMISEKWVKHCVFLGGTIKYFFQIQSSEEEKYVYVVLEDGGLYRFNNNEIEGHISDVVEIEIESENKCKEKIPGELKELAADKQHKKFALIFSNEIQEGEDGEKPTNNFHVRLIYKNQDFDITDKFKDNQLCESSYFVIYQGVDEMVFSHVNDTDLSKFIISEIDESQKEEEEDTKEPKEGEDKKEEDGEQKQKTDETTIVETADGTKLQIVLQKQIIRKFKTLFKKKLSDEHLQIGKIHTMVSLHEDSKQYLIFFDDRDMFIFNFTDKELFQKKYQYVRSFIFFENSVCYAICKVRDTDLRATEQRQDDQRDDELSLNDNGLFYYNLDDVIKNIYEDKIRTLQFKVIDLGANTHLSYSHDEERIGYFNELETVTIVPLLHTNFIKFIGINKESEYLSFKVIKDRFLALHQSGKIETWNLITGKYISYHQISSTWLDKYELHSPKSDGKYQKRGKILLKSKEEITDQNIEDFYLNYQLQTSLSNQKAFIQHQEDKKLVHWKYIEIKSEKEIEEHLSFVHPTYEFQYIYISNNLQNPYMIERLAYSKTYLYQVNKINKNEIKWEAIRRLENYDRDLEVNGALHYVPFYSPDFSFHIDINRKEQTFQIRQTETNKILKQIPKDLLTFDIKKKKLPVHAINRIQWLDNERIRIVSMEGFEKIVDFQNNFKELGNNCISAFVEDSENFEKDFSHELEHYPYYYSRQPLELNQTESWLKRKFQEYESMWHLLHQRDPMQLNEVLFNVENKYFQYANLSFTFLHWSLIKQISDGYINVSDINEGQIQAMLYNILPGGNSTLHKLSDNDQPDDIAELFKISCPNVNEPQKIDYFIPIIPNFEGKTALHVAKDQLDYKSIDIMLRYLKGYQIDHHSKAIKDLIPHLIEKGLPEMPAYLGSRLQQTHQIKSIQKAKLKKDFNEISPFQLWYNTEDYSNEFIDKDAIERRIKCEFIDLPEMYHYTDDCSNDLFAAFAGTDNFDYFKVKSVQKIIEFNYPLVQDFTIRRLMVPYAAFLFVFVIYHTIFFENFKNMKYYQDIFHEDPTILINNEYFDTISATYKISTKYSDYISELITNSTELPYNQINYTDVSEPDYEAKPLEDILDNRYNKVYFVNMILGFILCLFSAYFILNEIKQLFDSPLDYLSSVWNYVDIIPPVGIFTLVALFFLDIRGIEEIERQIQALTTFFMWLKLLYFMRIFKNTGYLIRMIITVIYDMRHFLLVLLVALIAFGDTFLVISLGNKEENQFTSGFINSIIYTYCVILGGFDPADYENSIAYIFVMTLFLLCTVFNMIVMLNLLIAIISESFANVNSNAKNAMYQEMAALISENNYLIPQSKKEDYARANQYLMVITDLEAVDTEFQDPVQTLLLEIKSDIISEVYDVYNIVDEIKKKMEVDRTEQQAKNEEMKNYIVAQVQKMLDKKFAEKKEGEGADDECSEEDY